jgi:cbb3-type cytochrome oxidase cytochrome c subunit
MIRRWFFILMTINMVFIGLFLWEEWRPEWKEQFWEYKALKLEALRAELTEAESGLQSETCLVALRQALVEETARLEQPEQREALNRLHEELAEAQDRLEEAVDNYQKNYSRYQTLEIAYHQMDEDHPNKETRGADLRKLGLRLEHMKAEEERIQAEVADLDDDLGDITGERKRLVRLIRKSEAGVKQLRSSIAKLETQKPAIEQISIEPLGRVDRCVTCHLAIDDPHFEETPEPLQSHRPNATIDIGLYHPFSTYGCTICHEGQGLATRLAEAFGQEAHFHQPVLGRNLSQGSCLPCHPEPIGIPDLPALEAAPLLEEGRRLFTDKGCTGCHETEPFKHLTPTGPKLSSLAHKVTSDWLYRWVRKPKDYLPGTHMPDFLFDDEEVRAVTDFLLLEMACLPPAPAPAQPADLDRAWESGRDIFQVARCIIGPELTRVASKVDRDWLYAWFTNPLAHDPQTLMPHFRFTEAERLDLIEYLMQEFVDWDLPDEPDPVETAEPLPENADKGEALVRRYGCSGCHEMTGFLTTQKVSTELTDYGTKTVDLLDFGWAWDVPRTRLDWTMAKLRDPRQFRDSLLMPEYDFTEDEILALTTLLLALKGYKPPEDYMYWTPHQGEPPPGADPRTNLWGPRMVSPEPATAFDRLIDDLRCRSCHVIGAWGGDLAPDLNLTGSRLEEDYLRFFLKTPEAIRPLLVERMVRLNLTDEETGLLVSGLRFLTTDDVQVPHAPAEPAGDPEAGQQLYDALGCRACHMVGDQGGTSGPNLTEVGRRLTRHYLHAWLADPQALVPEAIEPHHDLDEQQVADLAAWLDSLTGEVAP